MTTMTDIPQPRCHYLIAEDLSGGRPVMHECHRLIYGWEQPTGLSNAGHFVNEYPMGPKVATPCGHPIYRQADFDAINRWLTKPTR